MPLQPLSKLAQSLVPGAHYIHYKGKKYKILAVGRHSETLEEVVIYQALYGEKGVWVRPLEMFMETILLDGHSIPRFKLIQ